MKPKFRVTVNGMTNVTLEAWSSHVAIILALQDHIALTQRPEVGQIDTITVERVQ